MGENKLFYLQDCFQNYLLYHRKNIIRHIHAVNESNIEQRLAIYSEGYKQRLYNILKLDYPILSTLLGEDAFKALSYSYLDYYPSDHYSVSQVGRYMSRYLTEAAEYQAYPYLIDLARLEWALQAVIDKKEDTVATLSDLQELSPEHWPQLQLILHSSVEIVEFTWDVASLWQEIKKVIENTAIDNTKKTKNLCSTFQTQLEFYKPKAINNYIIVWSKQFTAHYCCYTPLEIQTLIELTKQSFADVSEKLAKDRGAEQVAPFMVSLLQKALNSGIIAKIKLILF